MKKTLTTLLCVVSIAFLTPPAQAGKIDPHPVPCWFFQGENLQITNTCTYESVSGAGVLSIRLTWEDGVKTKIERGLQGRGERACPDHEFAVDGVCGQHYFRNRQTMQPVSEQEGERLRIDRKAIYCVQVKQNSVCWKF